jgi:outer membrane protein assembly factor BamA
LKESEYLLVRNKVFADKKDVPVGDIVYAVRPRTNKRTFGLFLWRVGIYQAMIPEEKPECEQFKRKIRHSLGKYPVLLDTLANDYYGKQFDKFRLWIQDKFGEEPVLLDSALIHYSLAQIELMMRNAGYFDAKVDYKVRFEGKRAKIGYQITAGEPYRINNISYQIPEPVDRYVYRDTARSLIRRGEIYSLKNLEEQRNRIAERLLNRGYYDFSKNYIRYEIDTNLKGQLLNLRMIISNPVYQVDDSTAVEGRHRCFVIQSINVLSDFSQWGSNQFRDSVRYIEIRKKTQDTNTYFVFYQSEEKTYKPSSLVYPIFFKPGDVYSNRFSRNTYDRYSDMQNFKFIKVSYAETPESKMNFMRDTGYLDCRIQLMNSKRRSLGAELLLKNTGGIFGVGVEFRYKNKNLFRAAEILSFSLKYTQELQIDSSDVHFKNFEVGGTVMLEFPRFLFPLKRDISKSFRPKTWASIGVNYLRQEYYSRFLTNFTFSYDWNVRKRAVTMRHSLSVLDFNLIKMYRDSLFDVNMYGFFSQRVLEKYKDHFILGSNYRFTMQDARRYVFTTRVDIYGNLLYGLMSAFGNLSEKFKDINSHYTIWGIPFASGIGVEADFVYNILQNKKTALVYHVNLAVGIHTMNSSVLPFEKSYYLGGANSMRGWRLRSLGPGSYIDTSSVAVLADRVGDIKFEANIEYRVPVYKVLHFGLFADIGNVWMFSKTESFPNANFAFDRFFKEIAVDVGVGLRLDLTFFIIRLDYAIKIHDPGQPQPWRVANWRSYKSYRSDRAIVLGIGYPF